jgi:hypothetical protein
MQKLLIIFVITLINLSSYAVDFKTDGDLVSLIEKSLDINSIMIPPTSTVNKCVDGQYQYDFSNIIFKNIRYKKECDKPEAQFVRAGFQDAMTEGLECLRKLNTPATKDHIWNIIDSLSQKENPLIVSCPSKLEGSITTMAYVYMNTIGYNMNMSVITGNDKVASVKKSIFHEYFHVIGYDHYSGKEYAYACSECCYGNNKNACKVCTSKLNHPGATKLITNLAGYGHDKRSATFNHLIALNKKKFPNEESLSGTLEFLRNQYPGVYFSYKDLLLKYYPKLSLKKLETFSNSPVELRTSEIKALKHDKEISYEYARILLYIQHGEMEKAKQTLVKIKETKVNSPRSKAELLNFKRDVQKYFKMTKWRNNN